MFSIGVLAQRSGVKVPTIRYYEKLGLMPAPDRSQGNQRRYGRDSLDRLSFIRHSRELGFSIGDIRDLLELSRHPDNPCAGADEIANRHLRDVRAKIERLERLESELQRFAACKADRVGRCKVIETLADHVHCKSEH